MEPFEKLTDVDKELIEDYIEIYGPLNERNVDLYSRANLETVLEYWNREKNTLFNMFGQNLIVTRPYTYKYNVEGLTREISTAMSDSQYQAFNHWWQWKVKHSGNAQFEIVDSAAYYYSKFFLIEEAFTPAALAENAYLGSDFKVRFEDGRIFKVTKGMKPMKILHKFIEKFGSPEDEEMFEKFRIWHSQLLNTKSVDGELCLSIHPLDYMTMSDNDNNWSSCMRWTDSAHCGSDAGDYRGGTVECMNSPYIIVAYLHNPQHPFDFNGHHWNSKRWRELFIVNEGCINEIKGYPYQDEGLTNTCLMWIKELADNLGWTYNNEEINMKDTIEGIEENTSMYFYFIKPDCMYKDIGTLSKHVGRINKKVLLDRFVETSVKKEDHINYFIDIPYGGQRTCVWCGEIIYPKANESAVLCPRCDNTTVCACCGEYLYNDDDTYWVDDYDEPLCYNCFEEKTCVDDLTDEYHFADDMTSVWLLCGYTKDKKPIWYQDKVLYVYDVNYNYAYSRLFNADVKEYQEASWLNRYYVTLDMIKDGKYQRVMDIFEIRNDEDIYPDDLYYLPDWSLAYPEEEEEEW